MARPRAGSNGKRLATPQSVDAAVKSICDIMRRSNCAGALQYVPELTKKSPLTLEKFEEFFRLLPTRGDGEHSWTVERKEIDTRGYDLKAVNPHASRDEDTRTPEELLDIIEAKGREVADAVAELRKLL